MERAGVPHPLRPGFQRLAAAAFDAADYLSLRDPGSVRMAGLAAGGPAQVVPDPVLGLARMWPKASLRGDFDRLAQRLGLTTRDGILAVSVRRRSLGDVPVAVFAQDLGARCKALNLTPVMIGLGSAHSDDRIAREVSAALTAMGCQNAALDQPEQLRDIAALIAYASAYAGSSLHGYIAAAAYGTPGLLVARPAYRKFDGLVQHLDRDADKVNDWAQALGRLSDAVGQPHTTLSSGVQRALTQHWNQIAAAINGGATPRRAARLRFAALSMGEGMRQQNALWAMLPYTTARDRAAALSGGDVAHKEPF
ncbi:polysaccharide pyruvyl transferase family protein [Pararhodobacter zhoushanensis]|uniref:Polysaccharide pyruvyl transferase family protein n=1 Tax=Pararhodobacter zhoushanensis TaxID=2479545 RepID=A0ABT3H3Z3_9RHOB|nr:polysaccharide pyruvyl transferase family protein [Pararhodobacter zhoushanensis]